MQKKDIIELIKYHAEKDEKSFRNKSYEIANFFEKNGDHQLGEYIMALMTGANVFTPQMNAHELRYFKKVDRDASVVFLSDEIAEDITGVANAINKKVGIHKILFEGAPGTGKTETAYNFSKILDRELYSVNFNQIIDSKLGQTAKNMTDMFNEIRLLPNPDAILILFDEIDAIALDRVNGNDLREMGRVTSNLLKEFDELNESIVIIATTNLFKNLDKALVRRFDSVINFDRYTKDDLADVATHMFNLLSVKYDNIEKNNKLLKKIVKTSNDNVTPGELQNIIRTSLAFSDPNDPVDYLRKIASRLGEDSLFGNLEEMKRNGFTIREIGAMTKKSKTQVGRYLNECIEK